MRRLVEVWSKEDEIVVAVGDGSPCQADQAPQSQAGNGNQSDASGNNQHGYPLSHTRAKFV
jgi:hypothetical protein